MEKKAREITRKILELAYVVCKEELAFTKYQKLLALEKRHGVEIGTAYSSDHEGAIFADLIALCIAAALKCKIDSVNLTAPLLMIPMMLQLSTKRRFLRGT